VLVVAVWVHRELVDDLAGGGVDDASVEVVDDHLRLAGDWPLPERIRLDTLEVWVLSVS